MMYAADEVYDTAELEDHDESARAAECDCDCGCTLPGYVDDADLGWVCSACAGGQHADDAEED